MENRGPALARAGEVVAAAAAVPRPALREPPRRIGAGRPRRRHAAGPVRRGQDDLAPDDPEADWPGARLRDRRGLFRRRPRRPAIGARLRDPAPGDAGRAARAASVTARVPPELRLQPA